MYQKWALLPRLAVTPKYPHSYQVGISTPKKTTPSASLPHLIFMMEIPIMSPYATLLSAAGLVIVLAIFKFRTRRTLPYPPGPPGEFLIGHLRVIPFEDSPTAYLNWGREYSKSNSSSLVSYAEVSQRAIFSTLIH